LTTCTTLAASVPSIAATIRRFIGRAAVLTRA
jgi:hypothetical protein